MALPFGEDLKCVSGEEGLDRGAKGVIISVHLTRVILPPKNGEATKCAKHFPQQELIEERGFREWTCGPSRSSEDHEGVQKRVLMVCHDHHRAGGNRTPADFDAHENGSGPARKCGEEARQEWPSMWG
jgi:hypothetical protein